MNFIKRIRKMTVLDKLKETLEGIDIRFDEPLKTYTYTKVGGKADYLVFPRNRYEMARVVKFANQENIPWMVLGNASNIIVREGGIRGFVIMCDKLNNVSVDGYTIEAEAGANLIETTRIALRHSLTGFEFACGIPGSVGGAVFMNAGAYGGEIAHILQSCKVLTKDGEIEEMTVDGEDRFSEGDRYDPNVPIVISYHTFPEDEEETDEMTDTTSESTEQNTPTPTPEPTTNEIEPLTVNTNSDLAAVLSNPQSSDADYSDFAATYAGRTIEFDAHVDYLQHYENYDTRYEMLISSGDWQGENTIAPGPLFKIEDFNVFEIGYNGEYLETGDNIHVVAKVGEYDRSSLLFYLDPITITER